jgi:hypothetical protein
MKFKEYINENISVMDDLPNNNLLTEAGLSRLLSQIKDKDFLIITAFRWDFDKKENIKRNRKLRGFLNDNKMGVYQLIGHWRECKLTDVDYNDCPKDKLVDVVERSFLVVKPENMLLDDFINLAINLTKRFDQDASLVSINGIIYALQKTGKKDRIGNGVTLNKISQAYSQFVKKQNIPFVFECEVPCSNSGRMVMKKENIKYPFCEKHEVYTWMSKEYV